MQLFILLQKNWLGTWHLIQSSTFETIYVPAPDNSDFEKLTADKFAEIVGKKMIKSTNSNTAARSSKLGEGAVHQIF